MDDGPIRAVSRAASATPGPLAASALELIPRQPTRDAEPQPAINKAAATVPQLT
jgi:hypothetical protein